MKGVQGAIKALAIIFAVFLVCGIGAALIGAGAVVGRILGVSNEDYREWTEVEVGDKMELTELEINVKATNVRIERGEEFQVLADEEVIEFRREGDKVYLEEKDFGFFGDWHTVGGELKVVLPEGELNKMTLDAGAGMVYAEGVVTKEADLELGAGRVEFVGLVVKDRVKISGGAGYLVVRETELKDLNLDMGVGKVEIAGKLWGNSMIDAGVGKLEIALRGSSEDYRMRFSKGLGSITVNGENMGDDEVWGNGTNTVKIDGGVGAIEVRVEEE